MRLTLAAPFVIVTACGGARPTTQEAYERSTERWTVTRDEDGCYADPHGECDDSEHTCNPPSPTRVRCMYGDAEEQTVFELDDKCWTHTEPRRDVPCPDHVALE